MSRQPGAAGLVLLVLATGASTQTPVLRELELVPSTVQSGARFGAAVSLDGDRMLVGAPQQDTAAGLDAGAAYVFERNPTTVGWAEVAMLTATIDPDAFDNFGASVALDGDRAIIGAPLDDNATGFNGGSAYVFDRDATTGVWDNTSKLVFGPGYFSGVQFGAGVALDGDRAMVGAPEEYIGQYNRGRVYVLERQPGGWWVNVTSFAGTKRSFGNYIQRFGETIELEGDRALVGAPDTHLSYSLANSFFDGMVYVFERDPSGSWNEVEDLDSNDGISGDHFGTSVALDGDRALVGAPVREFYFPTQPGSAYVLERDPAGSWLQTAQLADIDAQGYDGFGTAVALEGGRAVIGAPGASTPGSTGSVFVFDQDAGGAWVETVRVAAGTNQTDDRFGTAVALSGARAWVGSPGVLTSTPTLAGSAFGYEVDCQSSLGFQLGPATSHLCGTGLRAGESCDYEIVGTPPNALGVVFLSLNGQPDFPFAGGTLVSFFGFAAQVPVTASPEGTVTIPDIGGVSLVLDLVFQAIFVDPTQSKGFAITNALRAQFGP